MKKYYKVTLRLIDGTDDLEGYHIKSFRRLVLSGKDKKLGTVIVYKTGIKFREIITDIEIPYLVSKGSGYSLSSVSPVYFIYDSKRGNSSHCETLNQLQVYSEEIEKYLKEKLDANSYDRDANYVDPKEEYRKQILEYFKLGEKEFEKFSAANFKKTKKRRIKAKKEDEKIKVLMKEYLQK